MREESIENCDSPFVFQIIATGSRDNLFEVKMLLSGVVDLSTLKITVKSNNLRVGVRYKVQDSQQFEKSSDDLTSLRKKLKHTENFLIPENYDGDRVRADFDNKNRILIINAPERQ